MKKILLMLLVITISYNYSYSQKKTPGRIVAAADAAGALGGAGSVSSIAGWFSWTPAAPVAAIAICVGAVIGGVGMSCAFYRTAPQNNSKVDLGINPDFSENYFDQVGKLHNRIVKDYFKEYPTYDSKQYFDFIDKNKSNYDLKETYISLNYLEKQNENIQKIIEIEDVNKYILENLPEDVNQNEYSKFLDELSNIIDLNKSIEFIKNFESTELKNEKYDEKTKGTLGVFFSTYRHSLVLWN